LALCAWSNSVANVTAFPAEQLRQSMTNIRDAYYFGMIAHEPMDQALG
jgi:hypothetical protein